MWDTVFMVIGALTVMAVVIVYGMRILDFIRGKSGNNTPHRFPPLIAATLENDLHKVRQILESGQNITQRDDMERTALHHAVLMDEAPLVEFLIQYKAPLNAKDRNGYTPLHFTAQDYLPTMTALLLKHGADPNSRDHHGNSVLWKAAYFSEGRGEVIQLLLKSGADPQVENSHGISAVELAKTITNYNVHQYF